MAREGARRRRAASPRLEIAVRLGRIGVVCLIVQSFLFLLAPLFFLASPARYVDAGSTAQQIVAAFSEPMMFASIGDLFGGIGLVVLASAVAVLLSWLWRAWGRPSRALVLLGVASVMLVAAVPAAMVWTAGSLSRSPGQLDGLAATGGWNAVSLLRVAAALAFALFAWRVELASRPLRLAPLLWPVYAAVSLVGSVAFADVFEGIVANESSAGAFMLGLLLRILLLPVLSVIAYRDLLIRFPDWRKVDVSGPVRTEPGAVARRPLPLPPPLPAPVGGRAPRRSGNETGRA